MRMLSRHSGGCGRTSAFTMIEVVVVLVLVSLVSLAMVSRPLHTGARVAAETHQLGETLRYAQLLAMANNVDSWSVDLRSDGYTLNKNGSASGVRLPGRGSDSYSFPARVRVTIGEGTIVFDEWGSPGDASVTITLSDGSFSRTLTIAATTGHQT